MAYRDSTTNTGTSSPMSVTVPTGAAADDIAILCYNVDDVANGTVTWPTGFTQLGTSSPTADGETSAVAWKRLTGADSGTYSISATSLGSQPWVCQAMLLSGRATASDPVATTATNSSANPSPVSINATGVTAVAGDDLVWVGGPDVTVTGGGNGMAPPSGYTEAEDQENAFAYLSMAYKENVSAGATGTVTGTLTLSSGNSGWSAFLVRIPVSSAAVFIPIVGEGGLGGMRLAGSGGLAS